MKNTFLAFCLGILFSANIFAADPSPKERLDFLEEAFSRRANTENRDLKINGALFTGVGGLILSQYFLLDHMSKSQKILVGIEGGLLTGLGVWSFFMSPPSLRTRDEIHQIDRTNDQLMRAQLSVLEVRIKDQASLSHTFRMIAAWGGIPAGSILLALIPVAKNRSSKVQLGVIGGLGLLGGLVSAFSRTPAEVLFDDYQAWLQPQQASKFDLQLMPIDRGVALAAAIRF